MKKLAWVLVLGVIGVVSYAYVSPAFRARLERLPGADLLRKRTHGPRLYKWRDRRGRWQISDTPPPQGIPYKVLRYPNDLNVLPPPPQGPGR